MIGRSGSAPSGSRVEQHAAEAAAAHNIRSEDVMGTGRTVAFVGAKWTMWKRLFDEGRSMNAVSLAVVSHHTTIMHGLRK